MVYCMSLVDLTTPTLKIRQNVTALKLIPGP